MLIISRVRFFTEFSLRLCKEVFGAKRDHAAEVEESINVNNFFVRAFLSVHKKPIYIVLRTQQDLNCLCAHSINYICVKYSEHSVERKLLRD